MAYYKCGSVYTTQNSNVVVDTASGAIANFQTPLAMPLLKTRFDFKATQEAGTPTPQSPKAISGVSEIEIVHTGKNLLDESERTNLVNNIRYYVTNGVLLKAGTYTLSISEQVSGLYIMDSITNTALFTKYNSDFLTFSLDKDTRVWIDSYKTGINTNDTVQLEVNSSVSTYEPYNGSTTLINLGGTYYGGYISQDKDGKRELTVTHKRYILDSNLQERELSVGVLSGYTQVSYLPYIDEGVNGAVFTCDTFAYQSSNVVHTPYKVWSSAAAPRLFFGLETTITTRAEALSWFSDNPTTVIAPIAEPFTVALPDGQPIKSLPGVNNIFADTGDTSLQFRKIG